MEGNPWHLNIFSAGPRIRQRKLQQWELDPESSPAVLVMTKNIFIKEADQLYKCGYRNLVWDECHTGLQKLGTQIYNAVEEFSLKNNSRLLLSTGTPIPTSPVQAYPIIALNNPWAYPNQAGFDRKHVVMKKIKVKTRTGREALVDVPDYAVGIEDLHKALYTYAIRKTRIGTLNMKVPDIAIKDVTMSPAHSKLYQKLIRQRVLEVGSKLLNMTQASKLRQTAMQLVTSPNSYTDTLITDNMPLAMVDEIMAEYPDSERFVLVAHYNQSVEALMQKYEKHRPCVVYGGSKSTTAQNQVEAKRFQNGGSKLMIMNATAGGVGLTLGHVCSNVIFVEPVSTYGVFDQAVSRVLLVEKEEPVSVYIIRVAGTGWVKAVENMLSRSAQIKQANQDADNLLSELLGN
jgi:hypothetical protein